MSLGTISKKRFLLLLTLSLYFLSPCITQSVVECEMQGFPITLSIDPSSNSEALRWFDIREPVTLRLTAENQSPVEVEVCLGRESMPGLSLVKDTITAFILGNRGEESKDITLQPGRYILYISGRYPHRFEAKATVSLQSLSSLPIR